MSQSLFDLVKTLHQGEKKMISEKIRNTKRKQYYTDIITIYSKSEKYLQDLDERIFKSKSPKFISDCKNKCKQLLYDGLLALEANKSLRHQLEQKLKIANILKNRNQFEEALKVLKRIESLAIQYEFLELLGRIRNNKLSTEITYAVERRNIDLDYIRSLIAERQENLNDQIELSHAVDSFRLMELKAAIDNKVLIDRKKKQTFGAVSYKKIKLRLRKLLISYHDNFRKNKATEVLKSLEQIIQLTIANEDVVFKGNMLGGGYVYFMSQYIEYSLFLRKKIDFIGMLEKFEHMPQNTILEQLKVQSCQSDAYCIYALSQNNPAFAIPKIVRLREFVQRHNISYAENFRNLRFSLLIYFALKKWDTCLQFLAQIDYSKTSKWSNQLYFLIKLMCLHEKGDHYYFNAQITQHMTKRRKDKVKLTDGTNFNECMFNILYYLDKGNGININRSFNKVLTNYDPHFMELRYLIHWIVSKVKSLNNDKYRAFLEKNEYKHYDFSVGQK